MADVKTMTDEELKRIAAERGFAVVPRDRIKTVSASLDVTHEAEGLMADHINDAILCDIGHEIAVKLAEFKKLLITRRPGPRGEMVTIYSAKLDVIVPAPPAKLLGQPKPVLPITHETIFRYPGKYPG